MSVVLQCKLASVWMLQKLRMALPVPCGSTLLRMDITVV